MIINSELLDQVEWWQLTCRPGGRTDFVARVPEWKPEDREHPLRYAKGSRRKGETIEGLVRRVLEPHLQQSPSPAATRESVN